MKRLSEQLSALSDRARQTEETIDAARTRNRAELEAKKAELKTAADAGTAKMSERAAEARSQWQTMRSSVAHHVDDLRAKADARRAERDVERAQRAADDAEDEAVNAITFASYALDAAEWAIVDAVLARADADDLTASR